MPSTGMVFRLTSETMATNITPDQISKVLAEISSRVPKILLKRAFSEVKLTPTVEFVAQKALESDTVSEDKKKKIRSIMDSGDFSKVKIKENPDITKKIDLFYAREINKAIKQGRLPPKSEIGNLPNVRHFYEKAIRDSKDKGAHRDERA